jgi:uncharacterized membrane protein YwzB
MSRLKREVVIIGLGWLPAFVVSGVIAWAFTENQRSQSMVFILVGVTLGVIVSNFLSKKIAKG